MSDEVDDMRSRCCKSLLDFFSDKNDIIFVHYQRYAQAENIAKAHETVVSHAGGWHDQLVVPMDDCMLVRVKCVPLIVENMCLKSPYPSACPRMNVHKILPTQRPMFVQQSVPYKSLNMFAVVMVIFIHHCVS